MKRIIRGSFACWVAFATMIGSRAAFAQSSLEVNAGLQFNFASPGARSLGIGGAFVGLADDATSAYTNPAGLVNVVTPELAGELRGWEQRNEFPVRGHALGPPSGRGIDTVEGIQRDVSAETGVGFSFASFVYPSEKWSFALYRHKLADVKVSSTMEGFFYNLPGGEGGARSAPSRSELRLQIVGYGAATAYRIGERLSLGLSVARYKMAMDAETLRYSFTPTGPPAFTNVINEQSQFGNDTAVSLTGGLLWQLGERVTVGATYRQASAFALEVSSDKSSDVCDGDFNVPDIAGVGVSFRLPGAVRMTADYNRVGYSRLTRHFVAFNEKNVCVEQPRAVDYTVNDVGEVHLGMAKVLYTRGRSLILSMGWWNDPAHTLEFADASSAQRVLFDRGRSDNHYSAGVGVNLDSHRQIYAAYEVSRRQRILSVSTVIRF